MTDILTKMLDENRGTHFGDLSVERQAEYLSVIAQRGASDALKALGLNDENAAADIKDIRDLLKALRVLKRAAWTTGINAIGRMIGWAAVLALAALFMNGKSAKEILSIIGP